MCGIAGYVSFWGETCENTLSRMTDSLAHRGPDASGTIEWLANSGKAAVGLGHRRLSVIDTSEAANQPMHVGSQIGVFNGEIYNFLEIRRELEEDGLEFKTSSDTEVALRAISHWGIDLAVTRFNGMFAIASIDISENKLYLIRDRAGVKPLYLYEGDGLLLFASELKAFHEHYGFSKQLKLSAIAAFLQYGYIHSESCIFQSTSKVAPGSFVTVDLSSKSVSKSKYWDLFDSFNKPKLQLDIVEASQQLESLLHSAFQYRMIADVPVGTFLSGGYDSSIVTAMLQEHSSTALKTFTIGFKESEFDESPHARETARYLGTDHTERLCCAKDAMAVLPILPEFYDEPFGDASAIPTILVSRLARETVTVALSADAGDELFAGYNKYARVESLIRSAHRLPSILRKAQLFEFLSKIPLPGRVGLRTLQNLDTVFRSHGSYIDVLKVSSQKFRCAAINDMLLQSITEIKSAFDSEHELRDSNDGINKMLAVDYKTYLPDDILTKVDRATMSTSLEGREPLLDHRIAEFAAQLPSDFKITGIQRKHILKDVTHRYVPARLLDRPKKGFSIPFAAWLRGDLKKLLVRYLSEERIRKQEIFAPKPIREIVRRFESGDPKTDVGVWHLLMYQMWHERWM